MKHSKSILAWVLAAAMAIPASACSRSEAAATDDSDNDAALLRVEAPASLPQAMVHYHGFDVSFNPTMHVPNYVAWELTRQEVKEAKTSRRESAFAPDPYVGGCATLADYRGSGFDRGHMCPAADMKWDIRAMDDCHLLTNICPQANVLNAGAWNNLEISCRNWAVADSAIVIVCGPVLTDSISRYIGPSRVAVPERYFKVVLRPHHDPPLGIGFIMPNGHVPGGFGATALSIDQVEAITGLDFFPALPDDVEAQVEANTSLIKFNRRKQ